MVQIKTSKIAINSLQHQHTEQATQVTSQSSSLYVSASPPPQSCAVTDAFRFGRARRNGATSNRGHAGADTRLPVPKFIEVGTLPF